MRRFQAMGSLLGAVALGLAAVAAMAEPPASLEAAKALAAKQDLPLLVKFASEF